MQRVAVIGLGNIAKRHRYNLKQLFPNATLFALSASGRTPKADVSDCDHLVSDIEALLAARIELAIVASPAPFHAEHALPLISAGIPVLIEKPVVTEGSDIDSLIAAAELSGTPVAVGYCLRYLPSAQKMHQLITEQKLGKLYNINIEIGQYLPDWRPGKDFRNSVSANAHLGGGALNELSHELDYARWLFGELCVKAAILRSSDAFNLNVEDCVDLLAISEQGVVASVHMDFLQRAVHRCCRVVGVEGALEWDLLKNSIIFCNSNGSEILYAEPEWSKSLMYLEMLRDFIRMIKGEAHHCISLGDAGKTVRLIQKIRDKACL
jgi:predicted dehydrogenase